MSVQHEEKVLTWIKVLLGIVTIELILAPSIFLDGLVGPRWFRFRWDIWNVCFSAALFICKITHSSAAIITLEFEEELHYELEMEKIEQAKERQC